MSTSGSKSNEHVAHFLVDIHNLRDCNIALIDKIYNYFYTINKKYACKKLKSCCIYSQLNSLCHIGNKSWVKKCKLPDWIPE